MPRRKEQLSLIEQPPKPKKKKHPIPADWKPPQRAYSLADEFGQSVPRVLGIFHDYLAAHGVQYADYDAAFCNFIRNQARFDNRGRANGQGAANNRGSIITAFDREIDRLQRSIGATEAAATGGAMCEGSLFSLPAK